MCDDFTWPRVTQRRREAHTLRAPGPPQSMSRSLRSEILLITGGFSPHSPSPCPHPHPFPLYCLYVCSVVEAYFLTQGTFEKPFPCSAEPEISSCMFSLYGSICIYAHYCLSVCDSIQQTFSNLQLRAFFFPRVWPYVNQIGLEWMLLFQAWMALSSLGAIHCVVETAVPSRMSSPMYRCDLGHRWAPA